MVQELSVRRPRNKIEASGDYGWYVEQYNLHKPPLWAGCEKLTEERKRHIKKFIGEHGERAKEIFQGGLFYLQQPSWWRNTPLTIETLFRKGNVLTFYEKAKGMVERNSFSEFEDKRRAILEAIL